MRGYFPNNVIFLVQEIETFVQMTATMEKFHALSPIEIEKGQVLHDPHKGLCFCPFED